MKHTFYHSEIHAHSVGSGYRKLDCDVTFEIDGKYYRVPRGTIWDGASIPRIGWGVYGHPFDDIHEGPSLFHDCAYGGMFRGMTKALADKIYRIGIRIKGQKWRRAWKEWLAVRIFGRTHWRITRDSAIAIAGVTLLALCSGCQTTFDKTRNASIGGAIIDDGGFKAGTVEAQSIAQGETAILVDYSEDSSIFSPGQPMRHIKLTATGVDYVSVVPEVFVHLCDAFKVAKEAKEKSKGE